MVNANRYLQRLIKYSLDKLLSILGLLITSPIFVFVALILKLKGQDVFFKQARVGEDGKDFWVFKFTTMPKGSEKLGLITTSNDSRPFAFGKFLRKTKINELPQLLNVLNGSMSLVGPRPLVREQIEEGLTAAEIKAFYRMRPGITGAGSLYFHHEDRLLANVAEPHRYYREVILPQKKSIEQAYAEHWNLWLDIKLLWLTIWVVILDWIGKEVTDVQLDLFKDIRKADEN